MTESEYFGRWLKVIDRAELYKVLDKLKYINKDVLCPEYKNIFRAFNACNYDNCKVIFLGLDPYPQKGVATGLLFGNSKDTLKLSPSLEVIKECCIDYTIPHNIVDFDITLESWAEQGVLLINSALTCEVNKTGVHTNMWRPFISKLLKNLSEKETGLIYVLFGSQAKTFRPYINKEYNDIIEVEHPAYFARTNQTMPDIFTDIDKLMYKRYGTAIKWYHETNNLNTTNYEENLCEDAFFWPRGL